MDFDSSSATHVTDALQDADLDTLLNTHFAGRVVRKDLTQRVKEGANVPVYVLEYLLGMYCASDDAEVIATGLENVKAILTDNYVRPDEAEKVKSIVRERGSFKVIDRVTVRLNEKKDRYEAAFSNLGIKDAEISAGIVKEHEKLLVGGIWVIATLSYFHEEGQTSSPFGVSLLKPIQMPHMNMDELFEGRRGFTNAQWREVLIRSIGMEPAELDESVQWHLLARMIPFVENNYNVCELGQRGTGKSHIYKECSPNSILVSGGQTTVANLFYNMSSRRIGLVGMWDLVAFDEVAGISFKDKDGVQIMKDYMASGSFARGREQMEASASMVFVGNINQSVESLVKTSHLLTPFPDAMIDAAFFDRFHAYIPGWEIPKMRPSFFTQRYGFIVDYLAEFFREMRKRSFADAIDRYFSLGDNLNQRDVIAVRKTVSGLLKLMFPHGGGSQGLMKDDVRDCLEYAMQVRRRVKEQLKKIGGMEFYDVHFSYIDKETLEEHFVSVKEQGGGGLIPEGQGKPGVVHTIGLSDKGMPGVYRIEMQVTAGSGKLAMSGLWNSTAAKEQVKMAFDYFKANASRISGARKVLEHDFHLHVVDLQNSGVLRDLSLASLVAFSSGLVGKPTQSQMVVLGDMSLGGSLKPVESLAECLQVAFDAGGKRVTLPMSSAMDIPTIPGELFTKFQTSFYAEPIDAVVKALGVD